MAKYYKIKQSSNPKKAKTRKTLDDMGWTDLRDKLDREFSDFIRMTAADDNGFIRCPTCGRIDHWKRFDCSHYEHRDKIIVRWDEHNVIAQCMSENRFHGGNVPKMRHVLIDRYGEDAVLKIEDMAEMYGRQRIYDEFWLRMKIKEYRKINKHLKREKCL